MWRGSVLFQTPQRAEGLRISREVEAPGVPHPERALHPYVCWVGRVDPELRGVAAAPLREGGRRRRLRVLQGRLGGASQGPPRHMALRPGGGGLGVLTGGGWRGGRVGSPAGGDDGVPRRSVLDGRRTLTTGPRAWRAGRSALVAAPARGGGTQPMIDGYLLRAPGPVGWTTARPNVVSACRRPDPPPGGPRRDLGVGSPPLTAAGARTPTPAPSRPRPRFGRPPTRLRSPTPPCLGEPP